MEVEEEVDRLNEGLERKDYANDIFGESSPPHSVAPKPNIIPPQPNTNTPQPSNVSPLNIDLNKDWAELALEDDIASVNGSNDEHRPKNPEFNEKTDMTNVQLVKDEVSKL